MTEAEDGGESLVDAQDDYTLVASRTVFEGHILTVKVDSVRMSDGVADREVLEQFGAVAIVALDDDQVVIVNQYRHPVRARLDELPAGLLDVDGEPALDAAKRELAEEASLTADEWAVLVDVFTSPGASNEAVRVYLARGLHDVPEDERFVPAHEERELTLQRLPLTEAVRRVLAGDITSSPSVAGLLAAVHGRATDWRDLRPADAPWPGRPGR